MTAGHRKMSERIERIEVGLDKTFDDLGSNIFQNIVKPIADRCNEQLVIIQKLEEENKLLKDKIKELENKE